MNFRRNTNWLRGFSLVETIIATTMLILVAGGVVMALKTIYQSAVLSREKFSGNRAFQSGFTRLKNIDFFYIIPVNSALNNFGIVGDFEALDGRNPPQVINNAASTAYPYMGTLNEYLQEIRKVGFDEFEIQVIFMRRQSTNCPPGEDENINVGNLIAYQDLYTMGSTNPPPDNRDDCDPNIQFRNVNVAAGDSDYYDTFLVNNQRQSEYPSTHMRGVTIRLIKNGQVRMAQTEYINIGKFSGDPAQSLELGLKLVVSTPSLGQVGYDYSTTALQNSFNLNISCPYPSGFAIVRADNGSPLRIHGFGPPPSADILITLNGAQINASLETNINGVFDSDTAPLTGLQSALLEGRNRFSFQAQKENAFSPFVFRDVIWDRKPPLTASESPPNNGMAAGFTPFVGIRFYDDMSSTNVVAGIYPKSISLNVNNVLQKHRFDFSTGWVSWAVETSSNNTNYITPTLSSFTAYGTGYPAGEYHVVFQGGDSAGYKKETSWTFTVGDTDFDTTPPPNIDASGCFPSGSITTNKPDLGITFTNDPETGLNPYSIVMTLDSTVVVDSTNVGLYYDTRTGLLKKPTTTALAAGSHTLHFSIANWKGLTTTLNNACTFTVP